MKFIPTVIPDVIEIEPQVFGDQRGFFFEAYRKSEFTAAGISAEFVQDNHSGSSQGILRGLHYQVRHPQGKLVRAVVGSIFDVAVDLRQTSPTFGQWVGVTLSGADHRMVWVPPGFAHGFYVLSEWAEVVYKTSDYYAPEWERTLAWNDPAVGVKWPLVENRAPLLSAKDARGVSLEKAEKYDEV